MVFNACGTCLGALSSFRMLLKQEDVRKSRPMVATVNKILG